MEFYNFKKKLEEKEIYKDNMTENLKKLEKIINSELASKSSKFISIENDELMIEINENDLIEVIQFLNQMKNVNLDN